MGGGASGGDTSARGGVVTLWGRGVGWGGLYAASVAVAELFDLGHIEALQIWQCFDAYVSRQRARGGGGGDKRLRPPPLMQALPLPPHTQSGAKLAGKAGVSRWAVMASNANTDYAFYLPLVALVWSKVRACGTSYPISAL